MDFFYATILVLVVTNQRIVLAADSRKTYLDKNGVHKTGTLDKIYKTGDYYYAVSGFYEEEGRFSLHQIIHDHLLKNINFHEAVKAIVHALAPALKEYFQQLKKSSPAVFQQLKRISASGGEIFMVKRMNGTPTAYLIDYQVSDNETVSVTINTWSVDTNAIQSAEACFWRAIGNVLWLSAVDLSEREWALHPVEHTKRLIEEGIKRYPDFVSHPINIVELTPDGVRWIEKSHTSPNTIVGGNRS